MENHDRELTSKAPLHLLDDRAATAAARIARLARARQLAGLAASAPPIAEKKFRIEEAQSATHTDHSTGRGSEATTPAANEFSGSLPYDSNDSDIRVVKSNEPENSASGGRYPTEKSNEPENSSTRPRPSSEDAIRRLRDLSDNPFAVTDYERDHGLVDVEAKRLGMYRWDQLTWCRFQLFHNPDRKPHDPTSEWQMKLEWSGQPIDKIDFDNVPIVFVGFMDPYDFMAPAARAGKAVESDIAEGYPKLKKTILTFNKRLRASGTDQREMRPGHVELPRRYNRKKKQWGGRYVVPGQYGALQWDRYGSPTFFLYLNGKLKSFEMRRPVTTDRAEGACQFLAYYDCRRDYDR